jgi:exopolyphosphatase/guanosine-5'-triphosphate,3'-diphosphate pyrophosphatase
MATVKRVAAIDIGSNSILLTIVETSKPLKILVDEAHVTGLAKGLSKDGMIQRERIEKSIAVLQRYRKLLDEHGVTTLKVAATEAMRKAKNGSEVKSLVEEVLRAPVDLISGEREAELSFWSVQKEFQNTTAKKIVFDIGGASTELAYGAENGIEKRVSLKVGSVLLTEKFSLENSGAPEEPIEYVTNLLKDLDWQTGPTLGMGVAGTVTTLFAIHQKLTTYNRLKVHGQTILRRDVEKILQDVLTRNLEERKNIEGLPFDRADVFGGGICIIDALMKHFGWNEIYCMDSGVRFGLIYELATS